MRSRWAVRLVALAALLVWLGVSAVGGPLVGRLSEVQKTAHWVRWVLTVYARLALVPKVPFFQRLSSLPAPEQSGLAPTLNAVLNAAQARGRPLTDDE